VWLSFCWGVFFGIEMMVGEKMVSTSFGGAASYEERAPGDETTHARPHGAWVLAKDLIGYDSPTAT
jgi:hypothetical protein